MRFKVYNGPLEMVEVHKGIFVALPPKCSVPSCDDRLCDWISDRFCQLHAIEFVKYYDWKHAEISRES